MADNPINPYKVLSKFFLSAGLFLVAADLYFLFDKKIKIQLGTGTSSDYKIISMFSDPNAYWALIFGLLFLALLLFYFSYKASSKSKELF